MQLRKVEIRNGKSFYWACNGPDCPYESEEINYTMDNYHAQPPPVCPRCGRGADSGILAEGSVTVQQSAKPSVSPGEVGHWDHPDKE